MNTGNTANNPVNTGNTTSNPVNTGNTTSNPVYTGNMPTPPTYTGRMPVIPWGPTLARYMLTGIVNSGSPSHGIILRNHFEFLLVCNDNSYQPNFSLSPYVEPSSNTLTGNNTDA